MKRDDPIKGLKAKVHRSERYGTVQRIYTFKKKFGGADPQMVAEEFLKRFAADFGISPDLTGLKPDKVKESPLGKHVLFQQVIDGKPVSGAWIRVDIGPDGNVFNVQNDMVPDAAMPTVRKWRSDKGIDRARAMKLALKAASGRDKRLQKIERVFWTVKGEPVAAWKAIVRGSAPAGQWRIYLRAADGRVIEKRNMVKQAVALVFDPTPVATLNRTSIHAKGPVPDKAYTEVQLLGLDGSGFLDGEHVSTCLTRNRVHRPDGDFRCKRNRRSFREVMVYHHIDQAVRYLAELGFNGLFGKRIEVNVDGTRQDNSWYDPEDRTLTFGTGGIDDSEDAEIILHELGHAVQDAQVPGWGWSHQSAAMGEGFGDFLAASFFHDRKPRRMQATVFNWDYFGERPKKEPPHGRRLDRKLRYPPARKLDVHDFGEYWSACLWEVRALFGPNRAMRLTMAHHFFMSKHSGFADGAHAMLLANERLCRNRDRKALRAVFERRGIIEPK